MSRLIDDLKIASPSQFVNRFASIICAGLIAFAYVAAITDLGVVA